MRVLRTSLFAILLSSASLVGLASGAQAQVSAQLSSSVPPPPLPDYDQPELTEDGYIWTPGYWAWDGADYYWVPGSWVLPPQPDLLWTPGYWGWSNGVYGFNDGYWSASVGYYGDVDYGYGYDGLGYQGGYWNHHTFFYNRAINHVGHINGGHFYDRGVVNNPGASRVSYHGGAGGTARGPNRWETAAAHGLRVGPTGPQTQHQQAAAKLPEQRAAKNHGEPPVAATARPGALSGPGVVAAHPARGAPNPAPAGAAKPGAEAPKPPGEKPSAAPNGAGASHPATAPGAAADHRALSPPRAVPSRQPAQNIAKPQATPQHAAPVVKQRASRQQLAPRMQQRAPQMQQRAPQMEQRAPQPQQRAPQMEQRAPQMQQRAPQPQQRQAPAGRPAPGGGERKMPPN